MRSVVQWAKLGTSEIRIDLLLFEFLDKFFSLFPRICKALVYIVPNPNHAVPPIRRQHGVE